MKKILVILCIFLIGCTCEEVETKIVEKTCDCFMIEWEFITTGNYQELSRVPVECRTEITIEEAVANANGGDNIFSVDCNE